VRQGTLMRMSGKYRSTRGGTRRRTASLIGQINDVAQLRARDPQEKVPVDLEFALQAPLSHGKEIELIAVRVSKITRVEALAPRAGRAFVLGTEL
jgi:hypothetical protein